MSNYVVEVRLINPKRKDLDNTTNEYRSKYLFVCGKHFTRECFMNDDRNKLTHFAAPTLFD